MNLACDDRESGVLVAFAMRKKGNPSPFDLQPELAFLRHGCFPFPIASPQRLVVRVSTLTPE